MILYSDGGVEKHLDSWLHATEGSNDRKIVALGEGEVNYNHGCVILNGGSCFDQNAVKMIVKVAANLVAGSNMIVWMVVEIV